MTWALLWAGPNENAIVALAARGAAAAVELDPTVIAVGVRDPADLIAALAALPDPLGAAHLHVNDWIFAGVPGGVTRVLAQVRAVVSSRGGRLAITLHDLPARGTARSDLEQRRQHDYRTVAGLADLLIVSSASEADRLTALSPELPPVVVVPLPIDDLHQLPAPRSSAVAEVGILGFVYPGKGHAEVITALAGLPVTVRALGRPSDGQEYLLAQLAHHAEQAGVGFTCSGFLPEDVLDQQLRAVDVPVAPHREVSASASMNHWIAVGRRPLVAAGGYADELARRLPHAVHRYRSDELAGCVRASLLDPSSTWRRAEDPVGPDTAQVARTLLGLLRAGGLGVTDPYALPTGGWVVPGNRWDLVPPEQPEPMDVSVVVTHFDNQHDLDLVLCALALQTYPRTRLQIAVADDGSAHPPELGAAAELDTVLVRQDDLGFRAAAARNLGAAVGYGDLLVFLDADTIPEPDYVRRLVRLPTLLPDTLIGGRRRHGDLSAWRPSDWRAWTEGVGPAPTELSEPAWLREGYRRTGNLLRCDPRSYRYLISATMACRRALFTELGGFDASMVGYGGEDWDLAFRAWNAGAVLAYEPDAVAWHDGPDWAQRPMSTHTRRANKNAETLTLARRIPEPTARSRHRIHEIADVVVTLDATGWSPAVAVLTVETVLMIGDVTVVVTGTGADVLVAECSGDPRVTTDRPTSSVQERARARVEVLAPLRPIGAGPDWSALVERLHEGGLFELAVVDGLGPLVRLISRRGSRRGLRWAEQLGVDGVELSTALFGATVVEAEPAGLARVTDEPSLAAGYGGWG